MALPSSDSFKLLSEEEISCVIEILEKDLPDSYHILCFVKNVVVYKKKLPDLESGVCAPQGDFSDSTVLVYLKAIGMVTATYFSSTDKGCKRIREALTATTIFNNFGYILISALHDRVYKAIGTDWTSLQLDHVTPCNLYSISSEDALRLNYPCPEDVVIRELREEDADLIDSLWPHRTEGSDLLIRQVISIDPAVGLYDRSTNKLLSWILRWFYGGLGILQTVEEAKRKGYAQLVIAELSKRFARENWPIHATVLVNNHASNALFTKMGFKNEHLCHYLEYSPSP